MTRSFARDALYKACDQKLLGIFSENIVMVLKKEVCLLNYLLRNFKKSEIVSVITAVLIKKLE